MNREAITSTLSEERICSFSFEDLIYEEKEKDSLSIRDENSSEKSLANSSLDCSSSFTGLNILNDSSASNTNFLKNLGKLLRTWVRVSGLEKSTNQKAKQFWITFQKEKKSNKNLFFLMYGRQNQNYEGMISLCKDFRIQQENIPVSKQQFVQIQNILREQTKRQLHKANIDFIIKNSRVKNKEEFEIYLKDFMKGLQDGTMNVKLTKPYHKKQ